MQRRLGPSTNSIASRADSSMSSRRISSGRIDRLGCFEDGPWTQIVAARFDICAFDQIHPRPKIDFSSRSIRTISNGECRASFLNATSRSISLFGPKSSRRIEPNSANSTTCQRSQNAASSWDGMEICAVKITKLDWRQNRIRRPSIPERASSSNRDRRRGWCRLCHGGPMVLRCLQLRPGWHFSVRLRSTSLRDHWPRLAAVAWDGGALLNDESGRRGTAGASFDETPHKVSTVPITALQRAMPSGGHRHALR